MKLYTVEFAATLTVAAHSQREALHLAYDILDNPHCYPTYIHSTYAVNPPLDTSKLDEVSPITRPTPAPEIDTEPLPF